MLRRSADLRLFMCVWALVIGASTLEGAQGIFVETAGHPARGPADASVTIVEFGDFQCPHCGGMYTTLRMIEANYPEEVRLVFRQLPLRSIHPDAQKAAEASLCAFDQGQFWPYHDSLFEDQASLGVDSLKGRARDLGLDTDRFDLCLDSGEKAEAVERDLETAIDAGAYSTPTLYINGEMLTGNWPYPDVARMIDAELLRLLGEELER